MEKITYYTGESINLQEVINSDHFIKSDESLILCDLTDVVTKVHLWRTLIPRVTPFYAVKCNDSYPILRVLNELKIGFDCASKGEIEKVLELGCQSERIIYAHPNKPQSHLNFAKQMGVYTMTFDGDYELYKIKKHFPEASLVLRFRCEAKKALLPLGKKFGCDPNTEAPRLMKLAKDLNLNIVGISFHVGSDCLDFPIYEEAIAQARTLIDLGNSMGFDMKVLDIGGGFPGEHNSLFIEASKVVSAAVDKYFPNDDVMLMAEPGRYFVSSSMIVLTKIQSKREVINDKGQVEEMMYFLNDGAFGTFNQVVQLGDVYPAIPKLLKTKSMENSPLYKSSIWGPTCDSSDVLCKDYYMPNLNIGDPILFEDFGAYTLPFMTNFNGFEKAKIMYFIHKHFKPQMEREEENAKLLSTCNMQSKKYMKVIQFVEENRQFVGLI
ncbi:ornithine decarboxylase 1-like [Condylostylus longicornis]|uniref:ornithine decarboxylase 1-like n=1 Tax=Condylostylus longicornis TaxID=2530218 RepID=UPI00244DB030|nr:ornithine decarboxylase 1-like [Condylostylus longicornis]